MPTGNKSALVDADFSEIEKRILAHAMTETPVIIHPEYHLAYGATITGRFSRPPEFQDTTRYQK